MSEFLDDEFRQMEERELEEEMEIQEAVSIKDPISSLELQKMVVVESDTTVASVIELFQAERVACVLVSEKGTLLGIFTERDVIMKLAGKGLDYSKEAVNDYMTKSPNVLRSDDPITFALNRMTEGGYRHVPIVDSQGKPEGLVGILDIIRHLAVYYSDEVLNLPPEPQRGAQERPEGG
ncbi:MAG: CBS domain-containing protein [Candidatus Marinimicrobia bacterium]|jgi:CBS domain-containing protein|nr:CBS domain-containing protein [Candidatus Neomarinimicrobiota bacterium]MDP6593609.1 CBS domain-containing protein [Candidatus Neomarinimicrobiota bacterium]MDP6836240.1 CBS domain-containing protein [Candidatus Neomarinimicrobiota bacterium]MDP6965754.1 CBS domain-containing protein [Candidatus Neomarinimicrobiota bacterium]|tara:strand:+ start:7159 stop:7695 length:537 start_codon:yes stop_codon:yes gene_type:complete